MQRLIKYISPHLSILALLPCVLLSGVMAYDIYNSYNRMENAYETEYNAFLSHGILKVVHEVQKERGTTAGYLGSKGSKFGTQLKVQRQNLDKAYQHFLAETTHWDLSEDMQLVLNEFKGTLSSLNSVRNKVDSLTLPLPEALSFYTSINKSGLHGVIVASKMSDDVTISSELFAIYNFSYAKESAGIERAVLANVLAKNSFTPTLKQKHIQLITKQEISLEQALEAAPEEIFLLFSRINNSAANTNVLKVRAEVALTDSGFTTSSDTWFEYATNRIDELKNLEEQALNIVDHSALRMQKNAVNVVIIEVIIVLLGLIITLALYLTIQNRQRQSLKIAEGIKIAIDQKDMQHEIDVVSFDELGQTADNINKLTKLFSDDLKMFSSAADNITTLTNDTSVTITQSKSNLIEQKSQVESIASAAAEMSINVSTIAESMESNTLAVTEVVNNAHEGQTTVSEAVDVINQAANDMEESSKAIHSLNERVESISSMVDLISGIAEQTNLLALNAAIEAARAGEQGRGFAVVADEVRGLASRTQVSTDEIGLIVTQLQTDSTHAFDVINQGQKNALLASQQSELIKVVLDKITDQVQGVQEVTGSVSMNTQEQAQALNNVNENLSNIFEQSIQNVDGAETISEAATNIIQSTKEMNQQIKNYKT